jgi:hypothetical protein
MYLYIAKLYNRECARPDCKVKRHTVILLLQIKDDIALQPSCSAVCLLLLLHLLVVMIGPRTSTAESIHQITRQHVLDNIAPNPCRARRTNEAATH